MKDMDRVRRSEGNVRVRRKKKENGLEMKCTSS